MTSTSNRELFERARILMPGGVSSPVRAFKAVSGTPLFYRDARGARFTDVENETYLDFVMSWGPLILGHAHPAVVEAVRTASARGTSYGAPCLDELRLAELIVDWHPAVEKLRFVSSGTEAVMSAIRVARGSTGRDRILKFSGCYHGHSDALLVAAGSGLATFGTPSSAGVPEDFTKLTSVLPLDDEEALQDFFEDHGDQTAVAIIEPVPANNGLLLQRRDFLVKLRELTRVHGTLLLFDEVISGFRVGRGGASELYEIRPDLTTFGKVIGGGLPVGAFGGPSRIMDVLAPEGPVYQAGTLSGNPLAMAAGRACLETIQRENVFDTLERLGSHLEQGFDAARLPFQLLRLGSMFWLAPRTEQPIRSAESIPAKLGEKYAPLHARLLEQGVYLAPSAYEIGFLSSAHTTQDVDLLIESLVKAAT